MASCRHKHQWLPNSFIYPISLITLKPNLIMAFQDFQVFFAHWLILSSSQLLDKSTMLRFDSRSHGQNANSIATWSHSISNADVNARRMGISLLIKHTEWLLKLNYKRTLVKNVKIEWLNDQIRFLSARVTLMIFFHSPVNGLHFLTWGTILTKSRLIKIFFNTVMSLKFIPYMFSYRT